MECDCLPGPVVVRHVPIAASHHDTTYRFIALTAPIPTTDLGRVNVRSFAEVYNFEFDYQFAYQTSSDLETWSGASAFGSVYSEASPERTWQDDTTTLSLTPLYVRFGVNVRDGDTGNLQPGVFLLTMQLQFQNW